jgi:2-keto-4-pentenoate hydratase/2-oxohepta-3-ene-1,7-dioic acid hydratase in catechol pathway
MKIIAVGMNYTAHNKELNHTFINTEPVLFMKPDSALLKDGKPFFIPDFSSNVHYETEIVVKINKLGKSIDEKFACRYYDEITVGIDLTARDLQSKLREKGLPWEISKGFDGSAVLGEYIQLNETDDIQNIDFHLNIDGRRVQEGHTKDMLFTVDKIIAYASQFFTMKRGDLIFTGTPAGVGRIEIGNHLEGYIGERKLLDFYIR